MASPQRPLTGVRLTYNLTMGGAQFRVRIKESIGKWLGLTPVAPQTGEFQSGPNAGKKFLRSPAGFRFQSYTFLVQPGTTIVEPVPGCSGGSSRRREICTFSLGFGRGPKAAPITRWRIESWVANSPKANEIIGFITPSGIKHVWKESKVKPPGNNLLPDLGGGGPGFNLPPLPGGIDAGDLLRLGINLLF
jgi:hypothetical protein